MESTPRGIKPAHTLEPPDQIRGQGSPKQVDSS